MDRIGRYEILSELGRGAMGVVYRARDPKIGREVAIKTLKIVDQADVSEVDALRERLKREAQSAGQLSHPGIVTIYDVDEEDGLAYIAMELVEGKTLENVLRDGGTDDLEFVSDVLKQAAAALDYAHTKGIVHRDVKPANLMLTSGGGVKIMDFGIARVSSSQLTQTGTVMGTPSYMSPEQVKGEDLDGRSDQFSLGVIAYELLTNTKPFTGDNLTAVIFKIVSAEPERTKDLCTWIPEDLDAAVNKALAKQREDRFAACGAFVAAFAEGVAGVAPRPKSEGTWRFDPAATVADAATTVRAAAGKVREPDAFSATVGSGASPAAAPTATSASDKLPPLSKRRAAAEEHEETEQDGGRRWMRAAAAAAILALLGIGGLAATQPGFFNDPVGTIAALLTGGGGDQPPPDAVEAVEEPQQDTARQEASGEGDSSPAADAPDATQAADEPASTRPETERPRQTAAAEAAPGPTPPAQTPETPDAAEPERVEAVAPRAARPKAATPNARKTARPSGGAAAGPTSVYFRTTPLGARIVVDGSADWSCTSPCTIENLPPGSRTVVASLPGYQTVRRTFVAGDSSQKIVELNLTDARIEVILTSVPVGADIYIDGKQIPQKTNAKIKLAEGTYQVRVVKPGAGEAEQVLRVDRERLPFAKFVLAGR